MVNAREFEQLPSERLRHWRSTGALYPFGAHRLFVQRSANWADSDLPVLVLLHGFPTASFDWIRIWDRLAESYRLLAPDLLGFGFSDKPAGHPYSIIEQADLVEAMLAHQGIERWGLLAHDYGDTVAQELLARRRSHSPSSRLGLVAACLLNGGLFPESHRPRLIQKLLLSPLGPWLARKLDRPAFGQAFSAVFGRSQQPDVAELDEFWALIACSDGHLRAPGLLRYIPERRLHRARWVAALTQSAVPIRFINGLDDPISGAHMVKRYRQLVPNADVVELKAIGHYPQWEAPAEVANAVLDFFRRIDAPSS